MSNLVHCDGPDCDQTRDPSFDDRAFCQEPWTRLEQTGGLTLDFHSRQCLSNWAQPAPGDQEVAEALSYARLYWRTGNEPETQRVLTTLQLAVTRRDPERIWWEGYNAAEHDALPGASRVVTPCPYTKAAQA